MKKLSDYKYRDRRKKLSISIDNDKEEIDEYLVDVDYWVTDEPDVNYKIIDDIFVNSIEKNGVDVDFKKQNEISDEIKNAIINQLEYEI